MLTRREYGQLIFGGKQYAGGGGGGGTTVSVRRGTLTANTTVDQATGKISASIVIDGDTEPGLYTVDFQMKQGQRVVLLFFGGQALVLPISSVLLGLANDYADAGDAAVVEQAKQEAIEAAGEEIKSEVADAIAPVQEAVDEAVAKADALADDLEVVSVDVGELSSTVASAAETADAAMEQTTQAVQDLNGFKQTVEQTYSTKDDLEQERLDRNSAIEQSATEIASTVAQTYESKSDAGTARQQLQTQISQNASAISAEVSARTEAVDGALAEAKSYTNQTADGLEQSFANTYQTKAGMSSYATTAYVDETSEGIEQTFTKSLASKGKTYIGKPTPPYYAGDVWVDAENGIAYTCVKDRESGSYTASDWTDSESFVSAYIRSDVNGITVGRDSMPYKARVSSVGEFQVVGSGDPIVRIGYDGDTYITSSSGKVSLQSYDGKAKATLGGNNIYLSSGWGTVVSNSNSDIRMASYSSDAGIVEGAVKLYDNASGTSGSFSLSVSASYYEFLEIVYGDGTRYITKRVYSPNGKTVSLDRSVYNASTETYFMAVNVYSISGTSVSLLSNTGQAQVSNTMTYTDNGAQLYVYQVIGWR